eukprot:COSAG02_NODE_23889_length_705_cov_0.851485_2_plen_104_part_01
MVVVVVVVVGTRLRAPLAIEQVKTTLSPAGDPSVCLCLSLSLSLSLRPRARFCVSAVPLCVPGSVSVSVSVSSPAAGGTALLSQTSVGESTPCPPARLPARPPH